MGYFHKGWYNGNLWTRLVCNQKYPVSENLSASQVYGRVRDSAHSAGEIFVHGSYTLSFTEISIVWFILEISLFMQCSILHLLRFVWRSKTI